MAISPYPLNPSFVPHSIRGYNSTQIRNYVRKALFQLDWTDNESCNLAGGIVKHVDIIDIRGAKFLSSSSWINICASLDYDTLPTHVMLNMNGAISIYKQESLGIYEILKNLIQSALRTFSVLTQIGLIFDIRPMLDTFANISKVHKLLPKQIGDILGDVITLYQRTAARIDKTLHIQLLTELNLIGRVLVPEYNTWWKSQESMLAEYSQRIFGDNQTLSSYVHIAELTYSILIKNTNRTEEQKRYDTLKHGARVTNNIMRKVRSYERNPLNVYSDIMYYTFGEGNKYREKYEIIAGAEIFEALNTLGIEFKEVKDKLNDLRLFDTALDKVNLNTLNTSIITITDLYNSNYNNILKPTFKVIENIYNKQQKAIAELERRELARLEQDERNRVMNTNPDDLTKDERTIQNNQFIKQLNNAVGGVSEHFIFKSVDIKEFTNE